MNCIKCQNEHQDYSFRALQVQTFHVRDMGRESKVQALGDFQDFSLCRHCAEEKLNSRLNIRPALLKVIIPFSLLTVAGLILTILFWNGEGALRLAGLGMAGCGILCMIGMLKDILKKHRIYAGMDREQALRGCAWDCILECAPRKDGENDLTYIPVTEETLARKNGDLMILYDLVPEIAVEAHKRLHGLSSEIPPEQ